MPDNQTRLAAYLDRLALAEVPAATLDGLATILRAHRQAIAFENLDIRLGRPILIDSDSVFDKLVTRRRGGYCFEQNRLLGDMLTLLGFEQRTLLARVRLIVPEGTTPPRTHILLLVTIDGEPWLADGGFGGSGLPPLPLKDGAEATTPDGASHRIRKVGAPGDLAGEWLLERAGPPAATDGRTAPHFDWQPQYSFELGQVPQSDLDQGNHWTSTRPNERFTILHIASIVLPRGFASMNERVLTIHDAGQTIVRPITDAADYAQTLRDQFNLAFSLKDATALPLFNVAP
jgi:N-hydroxyarylamine O-acetyltransferase